ncbi:cation:proton antiporter [Ehrlichia ruminantium]|uniref:NADH dehydrogenase I chain M n=2 Tax=Ehrlichia ruminantium TaxID=779 RepID=A0A0H3M1F3_EHRRW|nr:cation:proton antiporter [Ehrlichia ruminantium]QLK56138.1 cation:proton antiporter [Ehrlichia ruminantium]UOD99345.1 cation:proton antiporter [Ehrlichia ruminantium]CAH58273.1 probable NADH-quinone oxidoreductase subunit [Ehrlichia ruminantium str. Welgevonden]CAI27064.1 NADH dehydrogenase I chain M [Ehrlichia ruminantium str. Welgevonden]
MTMGKYVIDLVMSFFDLFSITLSDLLYKIESSLYFYNTVLFFVFSLIITLIFLYISQIKKQEIILYILYYLSSVIAISAESLLKFVISFEIMALSAVMIIATGSNGKNMHQVIHYSYIHFFAGVLLLVGASGSVVELSIDYNSYCKLFLLIGILINCASFPMSSWVPDAYSSTANNGIIVLSVFTTKVAAFALLSFFQGEEILLFLGITTAIYGIVFSILENNIKRLLCYNLVGQMGLVITAVGFSYSSGVSVRSIIVFQIVLSMIYQTLLFIVAMSVINNTRKFNLNEIGGLLKKMPLEAICSAIAILNMGAFPGTAGFISKFLVSHSIDTTDMTNAIVSKLFLVCSTLLFVSVGLKFFWFVFISKPRDGFIFNQMKQNIGARVSMVVLVLICIFLGMYGSYHLFYNLSYEQLHSVILQGGIIIGSILLFICFCSFFKGRINFTMELDWFYRILLARFMLFIGDFLLYVSGIIVSIISYVLNCSTLLLCETHGKVVNISNMKSLGFAIILPMLFIIIMVSVYLCLNL